MNYIIEFNIMHPICQMSSIFSAEMRPPLYNRAAAVSENAQDIPQVMFNDASILNIFSLSVQYALPKYIQYVRHPVYSLQKCDHRRVTVRRRCLRMHSIC